MNSVVAEQYEQGTRSDNGRVLRFTHQARSYTLFKRSPDSAAPWYVHFQRAGVRHKRCLETADDAQAIERAVALIDRTRSERWVAMELFPKTKSNTSLQTVLDVYRQVATISPRTVKTNILSLLKIFERVTGQRRDPSKILLTEIDRALATKFQDAMVQLYTTGISDGPAHREARERALRSSRSTICQARSIFSRKGDQDLIDRYADHALTLPPCIDQFMTCKLRGRIAKTDYHVPPDQVIQQTFIEIEKLKKDRSVYLGFWLAVGAGLRRKEIRFCDWSHIRDCDGQLWVDGGIGKDGRPIRVPIQERAAQAIRPLRKDSDWVVPGRSDRWCRRLCRWMRAQGWETDKLLHELRAYCGSRIYQESPLAAMRFLRHKSIAVTERHYVRYGGEVRLVNVL